MSVTSNRCRPRSPRFFLTGFLLAVACFPGCAGTPAFSRPVYEDPHVLVRLESPLATDESKLPSHSHPVTLSEKELVAWLRSVTFKQEIGFFSYYVLRQDPKTERAFSEEAVHVLLPHLQRAFSKARPEESVVFLVTGDRGGGVSTVTSGALWVQGDQLTVSLANLRVPVTTARKLDRAKADPLAPLEAPLFHVMAGPHQKVWRPAERDALPKVAGRPALATNYRMILTPAGTPPEGEPPVSKPEFDVPRAASIQEKLQLLKTWHEQGLITDEEYDRKRRDVLESL